MGTCYSLNTKYSSSNKIITLMDKLDCVYIELSDEDSIELTFSSNYNTLCFQINISQVHGIIDSVRALLG